MDESTLRENLGHFFLKRLIDAIGNIPEDFVPTDADVAGMLRIWYVEQAGFDDLTMSARACLNIYVQNKTSLPLDELQGSVQYLIGVLEGRTDTSGFVFLACGVGLAVALELERVAEILRSVNPESVGPVERLSKTLRGVEGAQHGAYHRLRAFGNRHLAVIEEGMSMMLPSEADMVLHALDGFVGDSEVAALYERMIDRLPEGAGLRETWAKYLSRVTQG